ncbi:mitotic interactor and substrate of PLK1 [Puma concolor]|uniref:Mitotic interactor and substrate of PLK1 n=1 Tax=Puma concolor TaxID=9696 RepID=A0A6P6H8L1_PUMCO|nr:mitotic interactor and substrate of PLK1 [Puma concolor]
MDRVTRYPIFGIPHSPRVGGLGLEEGTGHTFELVDVGPAASGWDQNKPRALPADRETGPNAAGPKASRSPCAFRDRPAPWRLGREGDEKEEAKACRRHPRDAQPTRPRSLEREHQALRKGSTAPALQGRPAHGDPGSPGQAQSGPPEEHVVDREQINFLTARRQFLSLEQAGAAAAQNLPARAAPACAPPAVGQASTASGGLPPASGCAVPPKPQGRDAVSGEKGDAGGLPAAPGARAVSGRGSRSRVGSPEPPGETPIEREIRRAQEREADLREQRGLRQAASQQEMVEIPTRPLLTKVGLASAPRRDRGRPSLYVQRDLVQETQREEDHRREGLKLGEPSTPARAALGPQPGLRKALSSDSVLGLAPEDGPAWWTGFYGATPDSVPAARGGRAEGRRGVTPPEPVPGPESFQQDSIHSEKRLLSRVKQGPPNSRPPPKPRNVTFHGSRAFAVRLAALREVTLSGRPPGSPLPRRAGLRHGRIRGVSGACQTSRRGAGVARGRARGRWVPRPGVSLLPGALLCVSRGHHARGIRTCPRSPGGRTPSPGWGRQTCL